MTWEPRPLPEVTPETEAYWKHAADEELLLGHCPSCDLTFHHPRAYCPDCLEKAETTIASGRGTVHAYTVSHKLSGWPEEKLPIVVAYVELEDGPKMVTNVVDCEPDEVEIGDAVTATFVPTEKEHIGIPVFELVD